MRTAQKAHLREGGSPEWPLPLLQRGPSRVRRPPWTEASWALPSTHLPAAPAYASRSAALLLCKPCPLCPPSRACGLTLVAPHWVSSPSCCQSLRVCGSHYLCLHLQGPDFSIYNHLVGVCGQVWLWLNGSMGRWEKKGTDTHLAAVMGHGDELIGVETMW